MAHEIATINGRNSMVAVEGPTPPWHGLGTRVTELMTAKDCMAASGLHYPVESLPVYARHPDGREVPIPDRVLNVRKDAGINGDDDRIVNLGLVSDKYKVVQNHEAFELMDQIVAEGGMSYDTAGALGKGERVWMLGRVPGHIQVAGVDTVEQYLFLYNSHDGTSALRIAFTPVRVVCANTVRAAFQGIADSGYTIRHTGDTAAKAEEARKALGMASHYFGVFGEGAQLLAKCTPSKAQLDAYWRSLYPDPEADAEGKVKDPGKVKSIRMTLFGLYEQGMGQDQPAIRGTAWAAYNAVTEHVDWHLGRNEARRFESAMFTEGARLKAKAWEGAMAMAQGRDLAPASPASIALADLN